MLKSRRLLLAMLWSASGLIAACDGDSASGADDQDSGSDASTADGSGADGTDSGAEPDGDDPDGSTGDGDAGPDFDGGPANDAGDGDGDADGDAGADGDASADGDAGVDTTPLALTIVPDADQRSISPYIYGANEADNAGALGAKFVRLGGNALSGYNWEINGTNVLDEEEVESNMALRGDLVAGGAALQVLETADDHDGMAMLTLPIGDYVAADLIPGDVTQSPNYLTTRFHANAAAKGAPFSLTPDTSDGIVYQDEFVNWVKENADSTPVVFALDNEPGIWEETHKAFHLTKATYDDVVELGIAFSKAAKAAWPEALISGPVSYGYLEYRSLQNSPDFDTKGEFVDYYLEEMAEAEQTEGKRLLDYLDMHWFPDVYDGPTRVVEDESSPALAGMRMEVPRSLWDPDYRENSWIANDLASRGESISLIPSMKARIADHYPGTKLAISDWYYGGGLDISGAVAAADVLGIFGREGVDLASVSSEAFGKPYIGAAFAAYLDYDGAGAHFGDTSVRATTDDVVGSSVYASVHSGQANALVAVAINKRGHARAVTLAIDDDATYSSCEVYELTGAGASFVQRETLTASAANTFTYAMPATSVVVLVPKP